MSRSLGFLDYMESLVGDTMGHAEKVYGSDDNLELYGYRRCG